MGGAAEHQQQAEAAAAADAAMASPASAAASPTPPASAAAAAASSGSSKQVRQAWPGDRANPFAVLFLSWLDPLLWRGYRNPLQDEDMYAAPAKHTAKSVRATVEAFRARHPKASFSSAIVRAFMARWLLGFAAKCVFITAFLLQPFWVGALVQYIDDRLLGRYNEATTYFWGIHSGMYLATGLFITSLVAVLAVNCSFQHQTRYATYLRTATLVFVYEKAMRLSPAARRKYTTGSILTMASVDAERVFQGVITSQWVWAGPVVIMVAMGLTVNVLGLTGLVGVGVMVLAMLYQSQSASKAGQQREALVKLTGERLKLTTEVLQGIRVIKLYNWEQPIGEMIERVRGQEIVALARMLSTKITAIVSLFLAPVVVSAAMFTAYICLEKDVSTERIFTALAFCNLIRLPMSSMPNAISNISDFVIAVKRVNSFMEETELPPAQQQEPPSSTHTAATQQQQQQLPPGAIRLEHASFSWDADGGGGSSSSSSSSSEAPTEASTTLQDVTLDIKPGQLVCVVGPVGAGKSSLVSALLGEIPCVRGSRQLSGRVSLVAQEAWIQNKSIRNGILFGRPYDRPRYRAVLKAAQLKTDLEILAAGDHTEIGERGVSLSGGQKARVSLARALYEAEADIVLLDDPLAAVDAHVAKALFDTAISGVLRGKTRVLVLSSNYHLLAAADQVVVMEGGRVLGAGTYQQLLHRFPKYFDNGSGGGGGRGGGDTNNSAGSLSKEEELERSLAHSPVPGPGRVAITLEELGKSARLDRKESVLPGGDDAAGGALMGKEDRETGHVSSAIYVEYFSGATETRLGGALLGLGIVLVFAVAQACRVFLDLWLVKMGEELSGEDPDPGTERPTHWWLSIYWAFAVLTVGLSIFRSHLVLWAAIRSCGNLHKRLLRGVLRAPVNTYFDVTPLGRIVNRFSRDVDQVDQLLPDTLLQLLQNSIFLLSILALCVSSSPWFLLLFLPIMAAFYVLYSFFRRTSREVKRLEGVTRSPIYSSFTETLQGIVNIRAFRRSQDFLERHYGAVDDNTSLFLLFWFCSRWLAIRLDMLSTGVMAILAFLGVAVADHGSESSVTFSPSLLGLSLIYGLQLTGLLQWTIRLTVEVENNFCAVERLVAFLQLPEEAPEVTAVRPPADWPSAGAIEVQGAKLAYRPGLPLVLKGLDLSIRGGEKIGICGRTGAGKSSLGQALFRLVELQDGAIVIDGIDIKTLGLNDLRSRLTVIPQDPVLFSNTLRFNLDPFGQRTDHEVWEALRRVYLDRDVQALPGKLDAPVLEGGSNFSVGQRQLICNCRALLRKSRIVLMDEATACVDSETDRKIQETIRRNFGHCTVLTVAHRLGTIIDYNKIALLDRGRCLEFDAPYQLLQREGGSFAGLVAELGTDAAASLKEAARTAPSWDAGAGTGFGSQQQTHQKKEDGDMTSPVAATAGGLGRKAPVA